ncbi:MAG: clostripain-related cysteine peptidase, partial [Caloramator sp.]|nr:clostripain-related cysteine peptidase [Caloramator sp.]
MKSLCVLFYLDGNNDIEPEIYSSLEKLLQFKCKDVDLFVEVGREDREFVKVIRPFENISYSKDKWTGVKRYHIKDGNIEHFDLGKRNMANPKELYDFICWGLNGCSAKYNVLVIASHGFSFVGGITDLTFDVPYVMPIEDMCYSINKALLDCRKRLDLLFLDMCYMNYIEILYELERRHDNIQYVLTYYGEGDFGGIDYISFIENFYKLIERDKNFLYFLERDNLILSRPLK